MIPGRGPARRSLSRRRFAAAGGFFSRPRSRTRAVSFQNFPPASAKNAQARKVPAQAQPEGTEPPEGQEPAQEQGAGDKKYTDKDVDAIINKKFAKWKAEQEAAVKNAQEESAKLAKMNADQKHQYEMEKLQKENAELKRSALRMELGKTATGLLKEHNVDATQDILDFVVGEDAEETKERIDRFVSIVQAQLKRAEVERATGRTPKTVHNTGNAMSEIDKRIAKYQ